MRDASGIEFLLRIAEGRAKLVNDNHDPPFIVHLTAKKADVLRDELGSLGVGFGIPLGMAVPDPRDDEGWRYLGVILDDVHVYERANA